MPTCYMCDKPATSKEHVPPACIFPEGKDDPDGPDYRKNLITVKSCDEHNSEKSADDQFLMTVLAMHFEGNEVASRHFNQKVRRTFRNTLKSKFFLEDTRISFVNSVPTLIGRINAGRLEKEMEHIARALYFIEFHKKHVEPLIVLTPSLLFDNEIENSNSLNYQRQELKSMMARYMEGFPRKGNNQDVFYYQIDKNTEADRLLLKMVFYEGFEVYVNTMRESTPKRNS